MFTEKILMPAVLTPCRPANLPHLSPFFDSVTLSSLSPSPPRSLSSVAFCRGGRTEPVL